MKIRRLAVFSTLLLVLPAFAQTQAQTQAQTAPTSAAIQRIPAIIHSLQQVKNIRETQISPDGNLVAWLVSPGGIYFAPLSEPAEVRHIDTCSEGEGAHDNSLAWSPDSRTLAFFSNCGPDHKTAIFTDDVSATAMPHLLAPLNGYAESLEYSPSGKFLSFLYVEGATRPSGALAAEPLPSGVIGVEHIEVQRVAFVDSSTGNLVQITPATLHVYEYSWSRDSDRLVYVAAPPPGQDNWWTARLYTQDADFTAAPKVIFDPNTTTGPLHGLQIAVPRWSPDGSKIAFIGGLMSDQGVTGGDIYVIPSNGGGAKDLTPNSDRTASWIDWRPGHTPQFDGIASGPIFLVAWTKSAQTELGTIDPTTGKIVSSYGLLPATIGGGGLSLSVSVSNDVKVAYVKSSLAAAPEVYAGPLGAPAQQITHLNDALKPSWGKSEPIKWTNEGFNLDGWLLYPANYDPTKKYPLIAYVHGGPAYANLAHWPSAGFGPAPFSALGYFVLMPNPRGSYGEGEKFTQANRKDFGYGDLRDILAGVDAVVAQTHSVDPNRVGITGWSYGGFMTMFAVTQTHRFRAAVASAGISDWKSYYGENSIDQWMIPFFGASVYDDPAVYAKSSAINYIKNAKTPTLIVVGDRDGECPAPQSFEMWHGLRDQRVPTQLVVYAGEGHGFTKPADRINVLERALGWFEQHMPEQLSARR